MNNNLNSEIVIRSKLEKDDFVKANKVLIKMKSGKIKWITSIIIILFLFISAMDSILNSSNKSSTVKHYAQSNQIIEAPWYLAYFPIIMLFIIIITFTFIIKYAKKTPNRHYDSNKLLQQEMEFTFDDLGIACKSERTSTKVNWNEVYKVYISRDFFAIFNSDRTAWIIPKKNVDKYDIPNLINLLETYLDKKKIKVAKY